MKNMKLFTLAVAMLLGAGNVCAQVDNTFSFVDADGNEVPDGSTVTFYAENKPIVPGFPDWGTQLKADFELSVRNNTNAEAHVSARIITHELPNGNVQFCFPSQCQSGTLPADYTSEGGTILANASQSLGSEWFPEEGKYGTAKFTLQLLVMSRSGKFPNYTYSFVANGPTVKMNCIYADPAGISDMQAGKNVKEVARYDANGRKLDVPCKGLNIVKMSNGETKKVVIR